LIKRFIIVSKRKEWKDEKRCEEEKQNKHNDVESCGYIGVRSKVYLQRVECIILTYGPKRK
jgi:hypothetical protein